MGESSRKVVASSVLLRFFANIVLFLLLLLLATGTQAVHGSTTGRRSSERVKERKLQFGTSSLKISDESLLTDFGNVLSGARALSGYTYSILDMALSVDETLIYYLEQALRLGTYYTAATEQYTVKKAYLTATGRGSAPSSFAGPWNLPITSTGFPTNSTNVLGIVMLDNSSILLADFSNNLLRKVDVTTRVQVADQIVAQPVRLAKHPTEPVVFVSSLDRIFSVPLVNGAGVTTLAGPNSVLPNVGYVNSQERTMVRFTLPVIGARAISRSGSWLYVADVGNNVVRRVDTQTGATETIASGVGLNGFPYGSANSRPFLSPTAVALTSDACNLFIADCDPDSVNGAIHLLTFQQPDGNTTEVKTVAEAQINSASSSTDAVQFISLILSNDDQYLFASSNDGRIFKLQVNKSALQQCGPSPSGSSGTGSSGTGSSGTGSSGTESFDQWSRSGASKSTSSKKSKRSNNVVLPAGLGVSGFVVVCCIAGCCFARSAYIRKRHSGQNQAAGEGKPLGMQTEQALSQPRSNADPITVTAGTSYSNPSSVKSKYRNIEPLSVHGIKEFTLSEIAQATNNFGQDRLLEGGGFGDVYRAPLMVGNTVTDVAIKVMRGEFDELKYKQFVAEVNTLSRVAHRNLCKLLGYCAEDDKCILVYPFLTGGSLHDRLHQVRKPIGAQQNQHGAGAGVDERTVPLSWMDRMSIAEQMAAGLRYLHHDVDTPILHRDVKSRNVLMQRQGKHLAVYLIDFGLARSGNAPADDGQTFNAGQTVLTLTRSGTPGYMAPEYAIETKLTTRNDVYAFGVVLLELVTGRKAVTRTEEGTPMFLVAWSRQWLSRSDLSYPQLAEIVDHTLIAALMPKEWEMVFRLAKLGYTCTLEIPKSRPTMIQAMEEISSIFKDFQAAS